jgi:hypothetical protein
MMLNRNIDSRPTLEYAPLAVRAIPLPHYLVGFNEMQPAPSNVERGR